MTPEERRMLKENNQMLRAILAVLTELRSTDDMRQFNINVAADFFTDVLKKIKRL